MKKRFFALIALVLALLLPAQALADSQAGSGATGDSSGWGSGGLGSMYWHSYDGDTTRHTVGYRFTVYKNNGGQTLSKLGHSVNLLIQGARDCYGNSSGGYNHIESEGFHMLTLPGGDFIDKYSLYAANKNNAGGTMYGLDGCDINLGAGGNIKELVYYPASSGNAGLVYELGKVEHWSLKSEYLINQGTSGERLDIQPEEELGWNGEAVASGIARVADLGGSTLDLPAYTFYYGCSFSDYTIHKQASFNGAGSALTYESSVSPAALAKTRGYGAFDFTANPFSVIETGSEGNWMMSNRNVALILALCGVDHTQYDGGDYTSAAARSTAFMSDDYIFVEPIYQYISNGQHWYLTGCDAAIFTYAMIALEGDKVSNWYAPEGGAGGELYKIAYNPSALGITTTGIASHINALINRELLNLYVENNSLCHNGKFFGLQTVMNRFESWGTYWSTDESSIPEKYFIFKGNGGNYFYYSSVQDSALHSITISSDRGQSAAISPRGAVNTMIGVGLYQNHTVNSIVYHSNLPDGSDDTLTDEFSVSTSVKSYAATQLPELTGYEFDGWNTIADPTEENPGSEYAVGTAYAETETLHLYAKWKKAGVVTITIDKNGGTGGTEKIYEWPGHGFYEDPACTVEIFRVPELPVKVNSDLTGIFGDADSDAERITDALGNILVPNDYFAEDTTIYCGFHILS